MNISDFKIILEKLIHSKLYETSMISKTQKKEIKDMEIHKEYPFYYKDQQIIKGIMDCVCISDDKIIFDCNKFNLFLFNLFIAFGVC